MHLKAFLALGSLVGTAMAAALGKAFSVRVPEHQYFPRSSVHAALEARQVIGKSGIVPAFPTFADEEYLSPVSIGGQVLQLAFDTGSSTDWAFGPNVPEDQRNGRPIYNPSLSLTSKVIPGESFTISYASGDSASGLVYNDTVTIATVAVTKHPIGVANDTSGFQTNFTVSGVLGLSFPDLPTTFPVKFNPWWIQALPTFSAPVFCAALKQIGAGAWDFGFIGGATRHTKPLQYTSIVRNQPQTFRGAWGFNARSVIVKGQTTTQNTDLPTIVDSGNKFILLDPVLAQAWYNQIPGSAIAPGNTKTRVFPCVNIPTLPTISLDMTGGKFMNVTGRILVAGQLEDPTMCVGGIQDTDARNPLQVYGAPAFNTNYICHNVTTDLTKASIGFAPQLGF